MIEFTCPSCQTPYSVPDERAGSRAACKNCGAALEVPGGGGVEASDFESSDPVESLAASTGFSPRAPLRRFGSPDSQSILAARPMTGQREITSRQRNFIVVGILLLVGFVFPVIMPTSRSSMRIVFPNIEGLTTSPGVLSMFNLLLPLVAGVAAIAIAQAGQPMRGWLILIVGLAPVFLNMIDFMQNGQLPGLGRVMRDGGGIVLLMLILLLAGYYCLYIGSRVRWYRPEHSGSYMLGLIGGIAMLLFLCIPIDGYPIIVGSFMVLGESPLLGLILITAMGSLLVVSLVAIVNTPARHLRTASASARLSHWLLMVSLILLLLTFTLGVTMALRGVTSPTEILAIAVIFLKIFLIFVPMIALAPMGIVDLMVGVTQRPGHCFQCDYDMRGIESGVCPECGHQNTAPRRFAGRPLF